jgi:YHS domain-containing protein
MKKMVRVVLALVLVLSVAGAGLSTNPPTGLMDRAGPLEKGKPQTACPVMGGKINQQLYADYQGQRVYFCCPACIDIFKKDPEKYLKKLREQGLLPEPSPGGK